MADYLDKLLREGLEVLKSRIPSGHPFLHDAVESRGYHKWVLNCISFLGGEAPDHVEKVKAVHQPNIALYHQAEQVFGILQSAVEFVRAKREHTTRESVQRTAPRSFNLDFLHPKLVEKCSDHFFAGKYDDCILNAAKLVEVAVREIARLDDTHFGVNLMRKAFRPEAPLLKYSDNTGEQEAVMHLYSGFIGVFKNPHSHKFLEIKDPLTAFEVLSFANHLYAIVVDRLAAKKP
jgi:uncharacterized protein (TIGR02391 family)